MYTNRRDDSFSVIQDSNASRLRCWNIRIMSGREEELINKTR